MRINQVPLLLFLTASSAVAFLPSASKGFLSRTSTRLFYDFQRDSPNDNVWNVLTNTEKWISNTLQDAKQAGNPLSRKEVSYVCETSEDAALVLSGIFRKLKEARELGEAHGEEQEDLIAENEHYERTTLRQTQVVVIPSTDEFASFTVFDQVVNAINNARRNARDYVTDISLDKLDDKMCGEEDLDWSVSVNCAHLHPRFGEKTPEQVLEEMKEEEEAGEIDLNLEEYKRRRVQARQSPYPSIVIEVRAMAPPEFTPPPETNTPTSDASQTSESGEPITPDYIQQLESLFAKSSLSSDTEFYDTIGDHIETISSISPMAMAQDWIAKNDPKFKYDSCAFTTSDTAHVDEAYEFVFANIAMQSSQFGGRGFTDAGAQKRQYLVMPHFLSTSATSMEKFATEVANMIAAIPSLAEKAKVSCLHPEHVEESKRSPVPVFLLQWQD